MLTIEKIEPNKIILIGRIDADSLDDFNAALSDCSGEMEFDLGSVDYINSAGLGLILGTQQRLAEDNGSVKIVAATPFVQEVFKVSGLDNLVECLF